MSVAGIIAEFDPFHNGHKQLVDATRDLVGAEGGIVAVIGGSFSQRGGVYAFSKWQRAEMALRGGVDLVLELPLTWSCASAERFAKGGVGVLEKTGVVDTLAFGSEAGETEQLLTAANALKDPEFDLLLQKELSLGNISYAKARQNVLVRLAGNEIGELLRTPNNTLAIEYLKANRGMVPFSIRREDSHNGPCSAGAIRELLASDGEFSELVPSTTNEIMCRALEENEAPARLNTMERAILSKFRMLCPEEYSFLPDCSEGLENRLYQAGREACSLEAFYDMVKTKRYTHARIRRLAVYAWLDIFKEDLPDEVPYIRVLGFNEKGRKILKEMRKKAVAPVITKPASACSLSQEIKSTFELEALATDFRQLCLEDMSQSKGGKEWVTNPVML